MGAERIFGHQIAGHPVSPGAAPSAVRVHLARTAPPLERGAAANVGKEPGGDPQLSESRAAKIPRKNREIWARCDIAVWPYPHVVRPCRTPARASGVNPD